MKRLSGTNEEISRILAAEQLELSRQNLDVEEAVRQIIQAVKEGGDQTATPRMAPRIRPTTIRFTSVIPVHLFHKFFICFFTSFPL